MIAKMLLMSLLFFSMLLPSIASRERTAARGFKKMLKWMLIFCVLYVLSTIYVYPRLNTG